MASQYVNGPGTPSHGEFRPTQGSDRDVSRNRQRLVIHLCSKPAHLGYAVITGVPFFRSRSFARHRRQSP